MPQNTNILGYLGHYLLAYRPNLNFFDQKRRLKILNYIFVILFL